ncbi:NUDIX hydrolase [Corynebacterium breve]|uniref:NUDIX hydrolase n=1 Tax=Corynebacterium breve TaxID=3049799 RepID=A0ABY8VI44_9CORY|nr:NUDIX hydrolase [Corynebacterium breve]WIM68646.1 NUDIX hydrolase [Corynebacterium breve]
MPNSQGAPSVFAGDHIDPTDTTGYQGGRLASTVLLIKDGHNGLEVWAQERVLTMVNYPGMTVFPGGGVDSRDFPQRTWNSGELWMGRSAVSVARRLALTKYKAYALVFAAVRETFEETGAFLVADQKGEMISDTRPFIESREKLVSHEASLTDVLQSNKLKVNADMITPWARWVGTSEAGNKFDTFSFVATLPDGQDPDANTGEADDANWFSPKLLLEGWRVGLVRFAPATWAQLVDLSKFDSVDEVVAAAKLQDMRPTSDTLVGIERYAEFFNHDPPDRIGKIGGIQ